MRMIDLQVHSIVKECINKPSFKKFLKKGISNIENNKEYSNEINIGAYRPTGEFIVSINKCKVFNLCNGRKDMCSSCPIKSFWVSHEILVSEKKLKDVKDEVVSVLKSCLEYIKYEERDIKEKEELGKIKESKVIGKNVTMRVKETGEKVFFSELKEIGGYSENNVFYNSHELSEERYYRVKEVCVNRDNCDKNCLLNDVCFKYTRDESVKVIFARYNGKTSFNPNGTVRIIKDNVYQIIGIDSLRDELYIQSLENPDKHIYSDIEDTTILTEWDDEFLRNNKGEKIVEENERIRKSNIEYERNKKDEENRRKLLESCKSQLSSMGICGSCACRRVGCSEQGGYITKCSSYISWSKRVTGE